MEEVPPRKYKRMRRIETVRRARALNFACFRNQKFLTSPRACGWLAESVTRALAEHDVDLWAYCFMPSHVHLLVFPRSDHPSMADFLGSVKKSVARKAVAWVRAHTPTFLPRMRDEQPNGKVAHRFWQRVGVQRRDVQGWPRGTAQAQSQTLETAAELTVKLPS